jgi:hypothetical protein
MAHITLEEAKAWTEETKVGANFTEINEDLEEQVAEIVLSMLSRRFPTEVIIWTDETTTPDLVRTIIAMYYVSFLYDKTYSTDDDLSAYAVLLRGLADANIEALLGGMIDLDEVPTNTGFGNPVFYPNDISSASTPTVEDPSLGPAAFSMGRVF